MSNTEVGRIPVTIVEIDQPLCQNTYGTAPCTAAIGVTGTRKCFNTRATCQDLANYAEGDPLTLRFAIGHADVPTGLNIIPSVRTVKTSPTRLNVGGRAGRDKPLGRRAEATISFDDHPHSDNLVDPYLPERAYNPLELGTFWAKWLRRNLYYEGIPLRVREGYAGEALADMQVRNYVIEKITGPDSNNSVTIKATDILRIADNDKSQYPSVTTGRLVSAITDSDTSLEIIGGTLAEYTAYPTSVIRISDEIMTYTGIAVNGAGNLAVTGITRAAFGTTASEHDADATVQACAQFVSVAPWEVARDLLLHADVPSEWIPYADWVTEAGLWLGGFTVSNLISEPTGVTELLGQLCEQCSFYIWWDERAQQVKFRVIAPEINPVPLITETNNLRQGETSIDVKPEYRVSQVWVSYLPRDYSDSMTNRGNFKRTEVRAVADNFYEESRKYEIFSTWLDSSVQVSLLTFRVVARYKDAPRYIRFALDAKDRDLETGDVFDIIYKGFVDDTGATEQVRYQVISAHESPPGERVMYEAQKFDYQEEFRVGFWMEDAALDYDSTSVPDRFFGMWWADDDGLISGDSGYSWS